LTFIKTSIKITKKERRYAKKGLVENAPEGRAGHPTGDVKSAFPHHDPCTIQMHRTISYNLIEKYI